MVKTPPLLVCVLDALRADAVPSLGDSLGLQPTASGSVVPPFSFEPDAAFLCGRYPEETDSGTHFWYRPESSPFRWLRKWGPLADHLPHSFQLGLRRWVRWNVQRQLAALGSARSATTARIPFSFLPYFDIVQRWMSFDERFCKFPTIFDLLRAKGKRWLYLGAPVSSASSEDVWRDFQRASLEGIDLVFLFVGDLDGIGHRYGPNSQEYEDAVRKVGGFVHQVRERMEKERGGVRGLVFGDHGMVAVQRTVDVRSTLERLRVRPSDDYLYFLDSTLARFWFFNERARRIVTEAMAEVEGGRLITEKDRIAYRIRYSHNRFGELIWWADGGTLIFPNFWQDRKPIKGMHGYRREVLENHTGLVLFDPQAEQQRNSDADNIVEMVDVFALIVDLLQLTPPESVTRSHMELSC